VPREPDPTLPDLEPITEPEEEDRETAVSARLKNFAESFRASLAAGGATDRWHPQRHPAHRPEALGRRPCLRGASLRTAPARRVSRLSRSQSSASWERLEHGRSQGAPVPDGTGRRPSRARMTSFFKKGAVGLVDQGMSSLSNVLAVIMVAQSLSAPAFGSFSVTYAVLILLLTLSRSYFGTQLTLTDSQAAAWERASSALGAVLLLAPVLVVATGGIGLLLSNQSDFAIAIAVAVAAPLVCLQDLLRFVAVAVGSPHVALASDTVWAAITGVAALGLIRLTAPQVMVVWLGAAAIALAVAAVLLRIKPDFVKGWRLLRERHPVGNSVTIGTVAVAGASLVIAAATAHFLGPTSAGSLRGASTAMGPLNVLLAFVTLNLTPTLLRRQRSQDLGFCVRVALLVSSAVALWSAALLLLPDAVGRAVLGDSWAGARSVLPWTCAEYLFLCVATPSMLWLRVRYAARQMLQRRLIYAALLVSLGTLAAILGASAQYVAAAIAGAALINATLGWLIVLRNRSLDLTPATPDPSARSAEEV